MSQEPGWIQEGISPEEYFKKHFPDKDMSFLFEKPKANLNPQPTQPKKQKLQKEKSTSHWGNKLVLFSLVFMFIFSGWLILENTVQRDKIAYFETKIASLQEDYDALSAEYENLSSTHIKTESQMLKYKQQIENSAANKTSSSEKKLSTAEQALADLNQQIANKNKNKTTTQNKTSNSSSSTQNIPYKENYHGAVYKTRTGECYHYESPCGRGTYIKTTWADVNNLGLRPCGKCVMH